MKNIILFIILIVYIIYTIRKTAQKKKITNNVASSEKNETVSYEEHDPGNAQFWEHLQYKEQAEVVESSIMRSEENPYPNEEEVYEEEVDESNFYKSKRESIETISLPEKTEPKQYMRINKEPSEPAKNMDYEDKTGICSMFKHKHMRRRGLRKAVVWSEILSKPVSLRDE